MKLNIGIFCPYNLFRHGGVQEGVLNHKRILESRGHTVYILTPKPNKLAQKRSTGVIFVGNSKDFDYPLKTKADISISYNKKILTDLIKYLELDVLHLHEPWVPFSGLAVLKVAKKLKIPTVGTFHAKLPEGKTVNALTKIVSPYNRSVVKLLDKIVVAGEPAKEYVARFYDKEIPIIYNGVNLGLYSPGKIRPIKKYSDGLKNIVYINRLERRKGPDLLLKAFKQLTDKGFKARLLIASDGDLKKELQEYVKQNNLKNVEFLGFIDEKTKLRLYKTADIYCAPSPYGEGFGIVLLEAMSMQVPYLAGDNIGYRYASGDKANEYLVDPYDTEVFAYKLKSMLTDETLNANFKKWAKKQVAVYSYEQIVDSYEKIYQELTRA